MRTGDCARRFRTSCWTTRSCRVRREPPSVQGHAEREGKVLSPSRRRDAVDHVVEELGVSERRACRVVGQHRSTQRKPRTPRADEDILTQAIIALAERFGRYGYRRITELLKADGWSVSAKRVYRIWRRASAIARTDGAQATAAESPTKTTKARSALAGGRLLCAAQTGP